MKRLVILISFGLLAAACSSTATPIAPTDTVQESSTTQPPSVAPSSTAPTLPALTEESAASDTSPDAVVDPDRPPPEGPAAPDFTTVLASGESFTLSEASDPVYLVFWAEW